MAWSRQPAQRWRQASISATAVLVAFIVAAGVSFVDAAADAVARGAARRAVMGDDIATAPLLAVSRANSWDGRQYPITWLEGDESSPLPPGLSRLPDPGTAVVSPGLAHNSAAVAALGYALSSAGTGEGGTIGDDGLVAQSEWLVYVRADRPLGTRGVIPIVGFGSADATTPQMQFETDPAMPSVTVATIMVLWLIVIPSALLLALAASAFSALRVSRAHTLHLLGLSRSSVMAVGALETAALATPAVALGLGLWALTAPHVQRLPGTGITLVDSAMEGSSLLDSAFTSAIVGATVIIAMSIVGALPSRAQRRSQVVSRRPTWVSVLPLAIGLVGMVIARTVGRSVGVPILIGTLIATTAAFPFAIPVIVRAFGGLVARSARPHRWLAGRRLSFSPAALTRPALGVGMLVLVVGSATGIYLQMGALQSRQGEQGAYLVNWHSPRDGDVASVHDSLPGAIVAPLDQGNTAWFASCDEAAQAIGLDDCSGSSPDAVLAMLGETTHVRGAIGEAPLEPGSGEQTLAVFGAALTLEDVQAAVAHFPVGNSSALGQETMRPPLNAGWVAGGALVAAAALLVLAALHSFANRALTAFREDEDLLALGLEGGQVRAVQRWTMAAPLVVVIPVAAIGAMAFTGSANSAELAAIAIPQILTEAALAAFASGLVILLVGRIQRGRLEAPRSAG